MAQNLGNVNLRDSIKTSTLADAPEGHIGTYYLASNPQYYEPQRSNTFKFYIAEGLKGLLDGWGVSTDTSEEQALELAVKASSVPHFSIEKITITRGNNQMHFAGKPTFSDGSLKVHDYIGAHTKEILMAWQRQAYNVETEKVGLAKDYKRTAYLLEYTPTFQLVRTWVLEGCWVSGISEGEYDHDSADARVMDVTFVYDKAYLDPDSVI